MDLNPGVWSRVIKKIYSELNKNYFRRSCVSLSIPHPLSSPRNPRRMKRNPHVLDARVCRAVLWWNLLGEAMDAAKDAEKRRTNRRENRRLVVALAVSQRRGFRPMSANRRWSLPPSSGSREDGRRCGEWYAEGGELRARARRMIHPPHLDEAAILRKVYDYL